MRFPKPPEVMPAEVHSLETEVEVYRQTVRHMSATVDSLRVSRASRGTRASCSCWGLLRCSFTKLLMYGDGVLVLVETGAHQLQRAVASHAGQSLESYFVNFT